MKKIIIPLIFVLAVFITTAQTSEFSSPTILVGNVVKDLDKSIEFYTKVIGMTQTGEFSVDKAKATELGLSNKYTLDVAVLKLEDTPNATEWKIMSLGKKAGHKQPKWIHDDTGMQYITIFVNHLNPFIERMKKHNVEILSDAPSQLGDNKFFILVQDPDGTFIELIGPK